MHNRLACGALSCQSVCMSAMADHQVVIAEIPCQDKWKILVYHHMTEVLGAKDSGHNGLDGGYNGPNSGCSGPEHA